MTNRKPKCNICGKQIVKNKERGWAHYSSKWPSGIPASLDTNGHKPVVKENI